MAATVISVGDGDTLRVEEAGRKVTIRVACIDAPEMAQAPYGQQARQALSELLPVGSTVTLKAQTKDRYGRTVAEVFTQSGANAGLSLVQQGYAFAYRQYLKQCDEWAYLDREKLARKSCWGSRLLQRDGGSDGKGGSRKGVSAGQLLLPWGGGGVDLPLPEEWQRLAETFRRANGARASSWD